MAQELVDPPEDQSVYLGQNATFTAEPKFGDLSFQWVRQWSDRDEVLTGETSNSLTISNAALKDVGLYACIVQMGDNYQVTRAATLTVAVTSESETGTGGKKPTLKTQSFTMMSGGGGGGGFTLFAPPVTSGGSQGSCPGAYAGYVSYTKTAAQGWGWTPNNNTSVHTASDVIRTDTKVQYMGCYFDNGCNQTTVTVPHPTTSPKYRFTIFFPNNVPTTNAYPISLVGFNP